ncbi:L-lactate dehydrogenase [Peptoniphilus sp. ING2-D1G]|nr:L-lactate dehydrogenase [Peptoniphilus sp. ING2-D1G]
MTVVGAGGKVGTAISYALVSRSIPTELVLMDINEKKARGEAEDLRHCAAFTDTMNIRYGDVEETANSDIIIISAGAPQEANITRLTPLKKNVAIYKSMVPDLAKNSPDAIFLIVTNPVDILTRLTIELTGFPKERVIGSGTLLDTSRLKYYLGQTFNISPNNIEGYMLGEHGDTQFAAWSLLRFAGIAFDDFLEMKGEKFTDSERKELEDKIRKVAFEIVACKGGTDLAIGLSIATIVDCILNDKKLVYPLSSLIEDAYGYSNICLSLPTVIGREGVLEKWVPKLNDEEIQFFKASCEAMKEYTDIMFEELNK